MSNRPIVWILYSVIFGSFAFCTYNSYKILTAIIAVFFLVTSLKLNEKKFFIIILAFFIVSFFNAKNYYYPNFDDKTYKVKIESLSKKCAVGIYKGRRIYLFGNLKGAKVSDGITVCGTLKEKVDIDKGIAYELNILELKEIKKSRSRILIDDFYNSLSKNLGEDDSAIIVSACLGDTSYLKDYQKNDIERLGMLHVVSVSGFHMAIIYLALEKILGLFGGSFISFIYVILTGGKSATIRSFVTIIILKLSKKLYKNYDAISSLAFSACILIYIKPYYLFDIGFNLTYFATLSIILFNDKIKRKLYKLEKRLNESISIALSAQILTFPYIALSVKKFSPNFLLSNIFLVPIFSAIIMFGCFSFAVLKINLAFNISTVILKIILYVLNGGMFLIDKISIPLIYTTNILAYFFLGVLICYFMIKHGFKRFRKIPIILFLLSITLLYSFIPKIIFFSDRYDKGIFIKNGFQRVLLTNSKNKYFIKKYKANYAINQFLSYNEEVKINFGNLYFIIPGEEKDVIAIRDNKKYIFKKEAREGEDAEIFFAFPLNNIKEKEYLLYGRGR